MSKPITVAFKETGADTAAKAFDKVGDGSRRMAKQVDESTTSHTRLGERVGANERRFMGTADLLDGLGTTFGVNTQQVTQLSRGLADLSGGFEIVSGIIPAVTGLFPKLAGAMTFISAHPLMIGILVGGAIIAGLILLEQKFGIVSGAVSALGGVFRAAWENGIKPAINFMITGVEMYINTLSMAFGLLSRAPIIGRFIPDIPRINLPRLDVGGTVLQTGIAVVHRGEIVSPATGSPSSSSGGTVNIYVAGSVVTERELIDAVHAGLLDKQRRSGKLGIAA